MLIEIAHMGFRDGESGGQVVVNFAIGRVLVLPLPAKAYQHIIAIRGAGSVRRWASAESKRRREPGHVT